MQRSRPPARTFQPDDVLLGKYRVVRVIGTGGMGAVLEAENVRTTRRVAIKVLHGDASAQQSHALRRFQNEARAAARLTHPNSVDILDLEQDETGALFIVQELLRGETLYERMRREGRLPWQEAFELIIPVMSALSAAHREGIVHRDVKPENIFLAQTAPGVCIPKIIDFGVARVFNDKNERVTSSYKVVGTPFYMSPEQASGERELDGQTDVWAVGVVLYELTSGRSPFDGQDIKTLMTNIAGGQHLPLNEANPDVPAAVAGVVERALIRDRAQRYKTMDAFLDAACACLGLPAVGVGRLVPGMTARASRVPGGPPDETRPQEALTHPPTPTPPVPAPAPAVSPASIAPVSVSPPPPAVARRRVPVLTGVAVAAALALGFAGGMTFRANEERPPPLAITNHSLVTERECPSPPPSPPAVTPPQPPPAAANTGTPEAADALAEVVDASAVAAAAPHRTRRSSSHTRHERSPRRAPRPQRTH